MSRAEERQRLLIDSAVDYTIFTMNDEGRIDSWNVGAERMFGYPIEQIVGQHFGLLFTQEDRDAGGPEGELEKARRDGRSHVETLWTGKVRPPSEGSVPCLL